MDFVDDVHLFPARHGGILNFFAQVAHFVDAVVGGSVYFDNVHIGARGERPACGALAARRPVDGVFAVDGARKNFCKRGLARAAGAAEEIGVTYFIGVYLIF